ncbi:MAG: T9SS type A sorting domain-containing protein [Crocinitomicaceae bacterium]
MKTSLILSVFLLAHNTFSQEKGCDGILQESIIEANVYSMDGEAKTSERCLSFFQFQYFMFNHIFNSNPGSYESNWVFYLEEGEKLSIDSRFVSESIQCFDQNGFITVHSGELPTLGISEYSKSNGGYNYTGHIYTLEITDAIEFEIASPTYLDTIHIVVKIQEVEKPEPDFAFLNQINLTNSVIISTNSENAEMVEIYSSTGDLVQTLAVSDQQKVELEGLSTGIYFLRANVHGEQLTGKYMQF